MKKIKKHDELIIHHKHFDDSTIEFYCVKRMPNGLLAVARTELAAELFEKKSLEFAGSLVIHDLFLALKSLQKMS